MGIDFPSSPSAGDTYTYEGETYRYNGVAFVKVRDRVTTFNGATGAIIGVSSVNGLTGSVTLKPSGFEFEIISTSLSVVDDTIPSNGGIRLVRDYLGATQITFNRFDKQGNDLAFPQINLQNNGGTIVGISEDGEKFFHIVSPDRDTRTGHSFTIQSNTVTPGKLKFQDTTNIPNDGSPDTGLIAMDNFSVGDKIFVQFIPNIAPATTVNGVSGPIVLASTLELGGPSGANLDINVDNLAVVHSFNGATGAIVGVTSVQGKTGDVTLTDLEITHGVETFNGLSGSIDTTSLVLPVTGISGAAGITFSDGTFQPTAARSGFRYKSISSGSGLGTPSSGIIDIDNVGEVDKIQINMTDKEGNNLAPLFQQLKDNGGYLEIMTGDFSQALVLTIESQKDDDNLVTMGETTVTTGSTISTVQTTSLIEQGLDLQNIEDIYMRVIPNSSNFIREFNGITGSVDTSTLSLSVAGITASSGISCAGDLSIGGDIVSQDNNLAIRGPGGSEILMSFLGSQTIINNSATNQDIIIKGNGDSQLFVTDAGNNRVGIGTNTPTEKLDVDGVIKASGITLAGGITFADGTQQKGAAKDVATFTIQASSAITTDPKTNAMYRMPYNATLLGLQGKITANGNIRGTIDIAGPDFGDPTTGKTEAFTFIHTSGGNTFDHTDINQASVDAGNYLYVNVSNNASGATGAQFFVTYETRA